MLYTYAFHENSRYQAQRIIYADKRIQKPLSLFRARIYKKEDVLDRLNNSKLRFQGYSAKESFVPPNNTNTGEGRLNPSNIRYLYAASDIETSIAEVKASAGEYVSVGKIKIIDTLTLFDLSNYSSALEAETLDKSKWINNFILELDSLFQRPYSRLGGYHLCQFIGEYVKNIGFDGVIYNSSHNDRSSAHNSTNYTIFNYKKCKVISSKLYYIISESREFMPEIDKRRL